MDHETLSPTDLERYGRQVLLSEVGLVGQARLKQAKVLCIGAGGLGSPAALYLAAAGVGTLGLVDFDPVELTNLHRQVLYEVSDLGTPKVEAARRRLSALNPEILVVAHEVRLDSKNALEILSGYDVVIDGSDNFATRYLVNDACVALGKPDVWASVYRFEGQVSVFDASKGPCYRCVFPVAPGDEFSCAGGGVLGVLPGIVGTLQAAEALKVVLGLGRTLVGRLLLYDARSASFDEVAVPRDPRCPVCAGAGNFPARSVSELERAPGSDADLGPSSESTMSSVTDGLAGPKASPVSCEALAARMGGPEPVVILDCREPAEWDLCHLEGAVLVPMRSVPGALMRFDAEVETIVVCHHGPRSAAVADFMHSRGFRQVAWLEGGLQAWAERIDPSMRQY